MTKKSKVVVDAEVIENTEKPNEAPAGELVRSEPISVVAGLSVTTDQLKSALDAQTEQRKLIKDFVRKHLKPGVDYLRIHVVRNCPQEETRRGSCKNANHFSKDILAKPGQEKIFSLFQLTSELVRDNETMEMLAGTKNLVAYKCIVRNGDRVVAEGRGAAIVGDNRRDVNATIKIAEKRARMDACLALGFSEYFAQDLDDPDYQNQKRAAEETAANRAAAERPADAPIDDQERQALAKWLIKRGFSKEEQLRYLAMNGVTDPKTLTSGKVKELIGKLADDAFEMPKSEDVVLDDIPTDPAAIDAAFTKMQADKKAAELSADPELVVDEEMKLEVERMAFELCLNARGQMWLMSKIAGRPYAKWDMLTDENWRRAYDIVMAITDGKMDLDPGHIKESKEDKNAGK